MNTTQATYRTHTNQGVFATADVICDGEVIDTVTVEVDTTTTLVGGLPDQTIRFRAMDAVRAYADTLRGQHGYHVWSANFPTYVHGDCAASNRFSITNRW